MPLRHISNKKDIYYTGLMIVNFILIISTLFFITYLITPLFGGKFFVFGLLKYTGWFGLAFVLRIVLKKLQNERYIGKKEYLLIYFFTVINLLLSITYPFNAILSILIAIALFYSFKKRVLLNKDQED